jgi:UDP-3-O-[3-hydroxymyristoyl] glucosamine N-acyltransferase
MPDSRFYEVLAPASTSELVALTGARVAGEAGSERVIAGVGSLASATADDLSFCAAVRHLGSLETTLAGVCFVTAALASSAPRSCMALITGFPQAAYAQAANRLVRPRGYGSSVSPVDPSATLEDGVIVSPGARVGPGVRIGAGTVIGPGAFIGPGVMIGRDGYIGPGAVVGFALLGDRVRVHAGAIIGEPGFGAAPGPKGVVDVPQLGRVILQDGVTVGANSCIDRGAFDDTVVGENTKIDNLVQIAHNVVIGRNCLLAAQTGISGTTVIEDGCMLGGRVGISDHLTIGAGARLAAASGVMKNVPAGETWGGTPARPMGRWMRETATLARMTKRRPRGIDQG